MTYLTTAQVADMLTVSPKTVSRWALTDPSMPVTRLPGRLVRFEEQALHRWLRAHGGRRTGSQGTQLRAVAGEAS
jgi:excisionase family DNA binding protein